MTKDEVFEILKRDCGYYLSILSKCKKGHFLIRGYNYEILSYRMFEHDIEKRKPRNMPLQIHTKINNYFLKQFGWKIRNGVFCYGFDMLSHSPIDLGYGPFSLFFPIGEFSFVYSPDHFDLFGTVNQSKQNIDDLIATFVFRNTEFCAVMETNEEYDYFGNETSVKVSRYYLVNPSFADYFNTKIWSHD